MATTTKSTKTTAKSKTTKKPVKTAAAKAAPKTSKVTKKVTQKKAPAKQASVTKKPTTSAKSATRPAPKVARAARALTTATLRKWHLASAALFAGLAVGTGFVANASTHELTLSHVTKDDLATKSEAVLAPAAHVVMDLDLRIALIVILVISAVSSLLRATRRRNAEEAGVTARVLSSRWADFAVTFGGLVALVALLNGVHDEGFLKLLAITVAGGYFFAWLAEREAANANTQTKLFFRVSLVLTFVPWLIIGTSLAATSVYGNVSNTWYAYVATGVAFVTMALIARGLKRSLSGANYLKTERNYIVLNLVAKVAIAAAIIYGLKG